MSSAHTHQPGFPILPATAALWGLAAVLLALAWSVVTTTTPLDPLGSIAVVGPVVLLVVVSATLGLLPIYLLGPLGVMPTIYAYFGGAAVRFALSLLGLVWMVKALSLPAGIAAVVMVAAYLPLLAVESALAGRYLWLKDSLPPSNPADPPSHPPAAASAPQGR